jgi:hypothetical protein
MVYKYTDFTLFLDIQVNKRLAYLIIGEKLEYLPLNSWTI